MRRLRLSTGVGKYAAMKSDQPRRPSKSDRTRTEILNAARRLFAKEIGVSVLNGLVWGGVVGLFAFLIYHNWKLGVVMTSAMVLNLILAAVMGVAIPLVMHRLGRDPAKGSSVLITAITDSGGFFIFLGLATIFLR